MEDPIELSLHQQDILGYQSYLVELIESNIKARLEACELEDQLKAAVSYGLLGGGKRIRPQLLMGLVRDLRGDEECAVAPALAVEFLHASSLIHDDLPALDNDDMRRGRPSCHKAFGEATAILAGDALIALAQEAICSSRLNDSMKVHLLSVVNSSFLKLLSGQQIDVSDDRPGGITSLYELKTGALFGACVEFAVALAMEEPFFHPSAYEFGKKIGVYFQVADDHVDVFGSQQLRGRHESSDLRNQRVTSVRAGVDEESNRQFVVEVENDLEVAFTQFAQALERRRSSFTFTDSVLQKIRERVS